MNTEFLVVGIDSDGCLICKTGKDIYNCGETLDQFGRDNLTDTELAMIGGAL